RPADAEQTAAGCGACADDYSAFPLLHRGGEDFGTAGRTRADQHDERPAITYLRSLGVTGGGAPLPADEFSQAFAFGKEVTRDLGDCGDEAAAVVPQIENETARPLRLPHRGLEIFFDLRPESRDLDVADVIKRLPGDHAPLEFDEPSGQRHGVRPLFDVQKSHRHWRVARPVKKPVVGLRLERRLGRAFIDLVAYAAQRPLDGQPVALYDGEAGTYDQARRLGAGIYPPHDGFALDAAHGQSDRGAGRAVTIEAFLGRIDSRVRVTQLADHLP